ncbi:MAG: FAD-binding oxidoreductase, partial [Pseudomonadota bacterium]|nr:FAD-binding oxidoreductase [Pseudomonadota bacterium]
MTNTETFYRAAAALLGPRGFTRDADTMEPWLTDWRGRYTGMALGLASPTSTIEVAQFVKLCANQRVPIVPQGGNSGMSGGATPDPDGTSVILSLRRMAKIRSFDPASEQITCDAGVVLQTLHETAAEKGLRFPLTLGGKGSATIGGLIATNAGGTQVLRHGTMRAQVLGLEAVLADGSVFSNLVPLKKDNRGFDLKQMLIGSEGTLGIVTAATLRLLPDIADRRVVWVGLENLTQARALLRHCEAAAGAALEGFEVLPAHCHDAVLEYLPDARAPLTSPHPWYALIELVASRGAADRLDQLTETVFTEAMERELLADAVIASSEQQAEHFWQLRESISPAERAIGPAMQHDISVPVDRMPEFVDSVSPEIE